MEVRDEQTFFQPPLDIEHCGKIALTCPWGATINYGHMLLDAMPPAVKLDNTGLLDRYTLTTPLLNTWQKRHFELAGLAPREIAHQVVFAEEVIYTSAMHHFLQTPNAAYLDVRQRQIARYLPPVHSRIFKRLCLSRGDNKRRIFFSENVLVDQFLKIGFQVIDPGNMTVDEQIHYFSNADIVVGPTGAAFANVLYCRPNAHVIEIQPIAMESYWVQHLSLICGVKCLTYACASAPGPSPGRRNFDCDIPRFMEAMLRFIET